MTSLPSISMARGSKRSTTTPNIHFLDDDNHQFASSPPSSPGLHANIHKRSSTLMALSASHGSFHTGHKFYGGIGGSGGIGGVGGGGGSGVLGGSTGGEGLFDRMARVRQTFSEHDMRDILDDRELSKSFEGLPLDDKEIKRQPKKLRPYYRYLALLKEHYTEVDDLLRSSLPAQIATSFRPAESAFPRYEGAGAGGKREGKSGNGNGLTVKPKGKLVDGLENGDEQDRDQDRDQDQDHHKDRNGYLNGYSLNDPDSEQPRPTKTRPSHMETSRLTACSPSSSAASYDRDAEDVGEGEHLIPGSGDKEAKREKLAKLALNVNFAINTILLISKALAVLSSSSISLVASFVDSALDFLSTLIILGTSVAMGVKSERHAYPVGKRRFEPLGVLIFSVAMIASFAQVFIESFQRAIGKQEEEVAALSKVGIATMVATVVIKSVVWFWCSKMTSSAVRALAQDAENDVFFNLMSLAFPSIGSALHWRLLDPIGGMVLSLYIIYEWMKTLNENFQKLSGKSASIDEISRVLYLVSRFKPVQEIASIEVYHIGDDLVVEIDVILPETTTLHFAHDLGETIQCVLESLDHVARAYVHTDYSSYNPISHTTVADRQPLETGGPSPQSSSSSKGTLRPPAAQESSAPQEAISASVIPSLPSGPKRIPLYVSGPKAYCWDAQDVAILRVTHRICGLMAGTLPGVSQQNMFLGLPMVLMPEEVVLLVENGVCELINVPASHRPPTSAEIAAHTASRLQDISSQREFTTRTARERQAEVEQKLGGSDAVLRKREKRKKSRKGKGKDREDSAEVVETVVELFGGDEVAVDQSKDTSKVISKASAVNSNVSTLQYFATVPATSISHPWFDPALTNSTYPDLDSAREARVWTYPINLLERARCASFRKLWDEGMFMGQGIRFGGDFVVYPGDPLRYHSHFVTTTLPTTSSIIRPLELVAWGRLGTATKKAHLICCYDEAGEAEPGQEDEGMVECYSLEWGNFG